MLSKLLPVLFLFFLSTFVLGIFPLSLCMKMLRLLTVSQKFLPQKFSNDAIWNSMASRYFLVINKTHFDMFQVNFLSL